MNHAQQETEENVFKSPEELWRVTFTTRFKNVGMLDLIFEDLALGISAQEIYSETIESIPEDKWEYRCFFDAKPDLEELKNLTINLREGDIHIQLEQQKEWAEEFNKSAKPILAGKFFIASSAKIQEAPGDLIPITIDATRAFGTGDHETTSLCLELLSSLDTNSDSDPEIILDIGSGSGILSFAAKKLWHNARVVGVDIDQVAVDVAIENAKVNELGDSEGLEFRQNYLPADFANQADIIVSNILANPLMGMAPDFDLMLKENGKIILSGFLESQVSLIIETYCGLGLLHDKSLSRNNWSAVMLSKKSSL